MNEVGEFERFGVVVLHDDLNRAVREAVGSVAVHDIAMAFVAALRPRRFAHWSSLASFAFAKTLPVHEFSQVSSGRLCRICGAYLRLEAFPSDEFRTARRCGVVRLDSLRYTLYDLSMFRGDAMIEPDESDRALFDLAVSRIANISKHETASGAERALGVAFDARADRKLFLGVLGACGVLASPARPGFWPAFVPFEDRASLDPRPYAYPVAWWRRDAGFNHQALRAFGLDRFLSATTLASL